MKFKRYTNALDKLYNNLDEIIAKYKNSNKKIVMFGANNIAGMIIYYFNEKGCSVSLIVDNGKNKQGKMMYGCRIESPDSLRDTFGEDVIVIIASLFQDAMIKQLQDMGYEMGKNIVKAIDLPEAMSDYSYVDRTGYTEMSDEEIKEAQLGVVDYLDKICKENNLKYYIAYGTLIGAVRHKGYIPWDDDIDIWMYPQDLVRLSEILRNDENYGTITIYDDDDDYCEGYSFMYDKNTVVDSNHFPMQLSMGISVDIFTLSGVPEDMQEWQSFADKSQALLQICRNTLFDAEKFKAAKKELREHILAMGYEGYENIAGEFATTISYPYEWFAEGTTVEFEGRTYIAPKNYDAVLRKYFGDYMQLPPVEQRYGWHYYKAYHKI